MKNGNRPKVGLALGGGGLRGLAHIGVLKMLNVAGIQVDYIAGTSMGGLLGAAYASGIDLGNLETEILRVTTFGQLVRFLDLGKPLVGFVAGRKAGQYFKDQLGDLDFDDLHIPLRLIATDLYSGQAVELKRGAVIQAMRATMSVPGVFEPVVIDELRLVDGGITNNVPADVVRDMGADIVIAVDVNPAFIDAETTPPFTPFRYGQIASDLWQTGEITVAAMTRLQLELAKPDFILRPKMPKGVTLFTGYTQSSATIDAGEAAMLEVIHDIKARVDSGNTPGIKPVASLSK